MLMMEFQTKGWRVVECAVLGFFPGFKKDSLALKPFLEAILRDTETDELGNTLAKECGGHYCKRNQSHCFGKQESSELLCFSRCKCGQKWDVTIAVIETDKNLLAKPISEIQRRAPKMTVVIDEKQMSVEDAAARYRPAKKSPA